MLYRLWGLLALVFMCPTWAEGTKAITKGDRVLAIYTENRGFVPGGPELIFAAWGDGQIVWSHDRKNGGAPFSTATVSPEIIANALKRFKEVGLFRSPSLKQAHFGPSSQFTTVLVRDGQDELKMRSWHEQHGFGPGLAATSRGIEVLDDRVLLEVLAEEPTQYLLYRLVWSEIRLAAVDLIPASGMPLTGSLEMRRGDVSWVPTEITEP